MKYITTFFACLILGSFAVQASAEENFRVSSEHFNSTFLLEMFGVIICFATIVILITMIRFVHPAQATFFKFLTVGYLFIAGALGVRSGFELLNLTGELYQIVFELFLYVGLFVIFLGAYVSLKKIYDERSIR